MWEAEGPPDELRVRSRSWVWQPPTLADGRPDEDWRLPQQEVKAHLYAMHFGTVAVGFWSDEGRCVHCGERFEPMGFEAVGYDPSRMVLSELGHGSSRDLAHARIRLLRRSDLRGQ